MAEINRAAFHYIKANSYRVVHADGAHGGLTPRGHIFAAFYSERAPIPQLAVYGIEGAGLGGEIIEERKAKQGFVREVEVGIMMDIAVAESLHQWLGEKISQLRNAQQAQASSKPTKGDK